MNTKKLIATILAAISLQGGTSALAMSPDEDEKFYSDLGSELENLVERAFKVTPNQETSINLLERLGSYS